MSHSSKRTVVYVIGGDGSDTATLISSMINHHNDDGDDNTTTTTPSTGTTTGSSSQDARVSSPISSSSSSSLSSSSSSSQSDGIVVHNWTPSQQQTTNTSDNGEEDKCAEAVTLQVWDFGGSKSHQEVQNVLTRSPCLALVVLGMGQGEDNSNAHLRHVLNRLQAKCPGSYVILALSQTSTTTTTTTTTINNNNNDNNNNNNVDNKEVSKRLEDIQATAKEWSRHWTECVEKEILDIECDLQIVITKEITNQTEDEKESKPSLKELTHTQTDILQAHTKQLLQIHDTVLTVNTSDGQGISELRKAVIDKATSLELFPHLTHGHQDYDRDVMAKVTEYVQDLKDGGYVLVPFEDFDAVVKQRSHEKEKQDDQTTDMYRHLEDSGHILLLGQTPTITDLSAAKDTLKIKSSPTQFVCVNPEVFANMVFSCIIGEEKKTYKLEANRFWPRDSGFKPPDPDLLARVLEALPQEGCIREAILPILWQDYAIDQTQILHTLKAFHAMGVFVFYEKSIQDCAGLAMTHYTLLSAQNNHMSVLMDMIPKKRPQLNWTSKPFKDDIQVTWQMSSVTCLSSSTVRRSLALIKTVFEPVCDYIHIWDEGVLIKFADATVCVESVKSGAIHVACRVNADDGETKQATLQGLWVHLAIVVKTVMDFVSWQLPGIVFQIKLSLFGSVLFTNKVTETEPEASLVKCLTTWRLGGQMTLYEGIVEHHVNFDVLFPFQDDTVWTPRDWLRLVLTKAKQLNLSISDLQTQDRRRHAIKKRQLNHHKSSRKHKGGEVKWKTNVEEGETKGDNPTTAPNSDTSASNNIVSVPGSDTSKTTSADRSSTAHVSLTKEEWKKKALELASQFVSCTLALAVADFVALKSQDLKGQHTEAQVTAARVTANAALAVHTGDLEAAAQAVIEAVQAAKGAHGKGGKAANSTSQHGGHQSRLCVIL